MESTEKIDNKTGSDVAQQLAQLKQLAQVVEMAPNAMIMINQDGVIELVNAQAEIIFGYARDELLGQAVEILLPERLRKHHPHHRLAFFSTPKNRPMGAGRELYGQRKDGSEFPLEIGLTPMQTTEGIKVLSAIADISERLRQETQFRRMVEAAPYGIFMINAERKIKLANARALQLFQYDQDDLLGQVLDKLIPPQHLHISNRQEALVVYDSRGQTLDIELSCAELEQSSGMRIVYINDIRERLHAQRLISSQVDELQRINGELNNFAYVASHDLKSPLRGIGQLASWIEEDLGDDLPSDTQNHLRLMRSRIQRMDKLLEDLLIYSRVGRNEAETVVVDCAALIRDIFELCATSPDCNLRLGEPMPHLKTRKIHLELVLRNLISNAIKHAWHPHLCIEVALTPLMDGVEFMVRDNGPGIAPEHHERVFAMFQTLKPRDEVEGSGIGLALVKKTVELSGGKVWLESDGKHGSTFRFTWPARIATGAAT